MISVIMKSWSFNDVDDNAYLKVTHACVNLKAMR